MHSDLKHSNHVGDQNFAQRIRVYGTVWNSHHRYGWAVRCPVSATSLTRCFCLRVAASAPGQKVALRCGKYAFQTPKISTTTASTPTTATTTFASETYSDQPSSPITVRPNPPEDDHSVDVAVVTTTSVPNVTTMPTVDDPLSTYGGRESVSSTNDAATLSPLPSKHRQATEEHGDMPPKPVDQQPDSHPHQQILGGRNPPNLVPPAEWAVVADAETDRYSAPDGEEYPFAHSPGLHEDDALHDKTKERAEAKSGPGDNEVYESYREEASDHAVDAAERRHSSNAQTKPLYRLGVGSSFAALPHRRPTAPRHRPYFGVHLVPGSSRSSGNENKWKPHRQEYNARTAGIDHDRLATSKPVADAGKRTPDVPAPADGSSIVTGRFVEHAAGWADHGIVTDKPEVTTQQPTSAAPAAAADYGANAKYRLSTSDRHVFLGVVQTEDSAHGAAVRTFTKPTAQSPNAPPITLTSPVAAAAHHSSMTVLEDAPVGTPRVAHPGKPVSPTAGLSADDVARVTGLGDAKNVGNGSDGSGRLPGSGLSAVKLTEDGGTSVIPIDLALPESTARDTKPPATTNSDERMTTTPSTAVNVTTSMTHSTTGNQTVAPEMSTSRLASTGSNKKYAESAATSMATNSSSAIDSNIIPTIDAHEGATAASASTAVADRGVMYSKVGLDPPSWLPGEPIQWIDEPYEPLQVPDADGNGTSVNGGNRTQTADAGLSIADSGDAKPRQSNVVEPAAAVETGRGRPEAKELSVGDISAGFTDSNREPEKNTVLSSRELNLLLSAETDAGSSATVRPTTGLSEESSSPPTVTTEATVTTTDNEPNKSILSATELEWLRAATAENNRRMVTSPLLGENPDSDSDNRSKAENDGNTSKYETAAVSMSPFDSFAPMPAKARIEPDTGREVSEVEVNANNTSAERVFSDGGLFSSLSPSSIESGQDVESVESNTEPETDVGKSELSNEVRRGGSEDLTGSSFGGPEVSGHRSTIQSAIVPEGDESSGRDLLQDSAVIHQQHSDYDGDRWAFPFPHIRSATFVGPMKPVFGPVGKVDDGRQPETADTGDATAGEHLPSPSATLNSDATAAAVFGQGSSRASVAGSSVDLYNHVDVVPIERDLDRDVLIPLLPASVATDHVYKRPMRIEDRLRSRPPTGDLEERSSLPSSMSSKGGVQIQTAEFFIDRLKHLARGPLRTANETVLFPEQHRRLLESNKVEPLPAATTTRSPETIPGVDKPRISIDSSRVVADRFPPNPAESRFSINGEYDASHPNALRRSRGPTSDSDHRNHPAPQRPVVDRHGEEIDFLLRRPTTAATGLSADEQTEVVGDRRTSLAISDPLVANLPEAPVAVGHAAYRSTVRGRDSSSIIGGQNVIWGESFDALISCATAQISNC
jgi:hypothetical protein